MKKKAFSIKDIASELNISVTTVSFVLNGKAKEKHISQELTQKVLDYVKEINYKPNQIAQSLRTGKSNILVFMVEDISNGFFSKLGRIIEDLALKKGYRVIFCSTENDDEKSIELINIFRFRQVDGFIIVPSPGLKKNIEDLIKENIPVVLLDRYFLGLDCNSVTIDNQEATYNATSHLIKNNFNNIGFITTDSEQMQMCDRLHGYEKAVLENNLKPQILKIPYKETSNGKSKEFISNFLKKSANLDALFFATNYLTQTGLEALKEKSPNLIQEIGIITFDDNNLFEICTPSITAVSQPLREISNKLMNLLLPMLKHKEVKESTVNILLKAELIVRESSVLKK